jgi:hypothetical protein
MRRQRSWGTPDTAAQRSGLPDAFGVRGVGQVGRRRCRAREGATIGNGTLIRAGTNNGDRSDCLNVFHLVHICTSSIIGLHRT